VLFGLTALVFLGQLAANKDLLERTELVKLMLGGLRGLPRFDGLIETFDAVRSEPLRLLSAVFVHMNGLHFAFNMLALAGLGRVAEPGVGTARFVVAYLASGVMGFVTSVVVSEGLGSASFTAGASGAVFGVSGLILGWLFWTRDRRWAGFDRRWRSYAVTTAASLLLVNVFPVHVNNAAHVGGLACGVAFGFYYAARPQPRSLLIPNVGALLGLVLSVLSLVLAQRSMGMTAVQEGDRTTERDPVAHALIAPTRSPSKPQSLQAPQETP
jgi:membrane associated rhomboid family serine protease